MKEKEYLKELDDVTRVIRKGSNPKEIIIWVDSIPEELKRFDNK
jgi:hypothetical protein